MTENPTRVVPEGTDALDGLTLAELGMLSRRIGCDPYDAIRSDKDGKRWAALPLVAMVWAQRTDPTAKVDTFLPLTGGQLQTVLGMDDDDQADDPDDDPENPTAHAPAS